jgi:hypothetical protein
MSLWCICDLEVANAKALQQLIAGLSGAAAIQIRKINFE